MQATNITELLHDIRGGNRDAEGRLMDLVYSDLKVIARRQMSKERRRDHTLQPTAMVHEAYLRIFHGAPVNWQDRAHFMAVAASQMRRVLIDHGRAVRGPRRGGGLKVELPEDMPNPQSPCDLEVIDDLIERLRKTDPEAATVVELKFFSGLTDKEIAANLGVSHSTIRRHWSFARAWLGKHLAPA